MVLQVGDYGFTYWKRVGQEEVGQLIKEIQESHKSFVERTLVDCRKHLASGTFEQGYESLSRLATALSQEKGSFDAIPNDFVLTGLTIRISEQELPEALAVFPGAEAWMSRTYDDSRSDDSLEDVFVASTGNWTPAEGDLETSELSDGTRNMSSWLIWDDVSGFHDAFPPVYEHEVVTYNYDDAHYFNKNLDSSGFPIVDNWYSSLPGAYLDTNKFNGTYPDELPYAIGSLYAEDILTDRWYLTSITTEPGNGLWDTAKLQGQLCYREGPSLWLVNQLASRFLIDAWDHSVPGYVGLEV